MPETNNKLHFDISSMTLHIMAMFFMLLDHLWATVVPDNAWMTCVGRLAFPIFAFMIAEGFFHTHDFKKYMLRLFIFALISEIPYDLMYDGTIFSLEHQNVLWTFLLSLSCIFLIEEAKKKGKLYITIPAAAAIVLLGFVLGMFTFVDYGGAGVLIVLVFYFFRGKKWWCFIGQAVCLWFICENIIAGICYPITIFGHEFEVVKQSFAVLALIPIWLYNGRQGPHSKGFKYFCYAFYPAHILILSLIGLYILK